MPDRSIPATHTPIEKALLVAHFLHEDGNVEWALIIYEILADLGETSAITRLADIISAPPEYMDVSRAKQLYKKACMLGDYAACHNLGVLYDDLGDSVSAQRYYSMASERGAPSV